MTICEECGELYCTWRGDCPNQKNHLTDAQKAFVADLVPDDSQCIGWIQ